MKKKVLYRQLGELQSCLKGIGALLQNQSRDFYLNHEELFCIGVLVDKMGLELRQIEKCLSNKSDRL